MTERVTSLGWWAIAGEDLLEMLQRVAAGEDPDMVYMNAYAHCHREHHGRNDG